MRKSVKLCCHARMRSVSRTCALVLLVGGALAAPPLPTARQLDFMELETIQFMHFNVDTAWQPSAATTY